MSAPDIDKVLAEYHELSTRAINPPGTFDNAGRFYLSERGACCAGLRSPSRAYPYSQMVHGRTLKHIATMRGVSVHEARSALARMIVRQRPAATAPSGLCLECGASWECEHGAKPTAGMDSISLAEAARQFDRHLAGPAAGITEILERRSA